MAETEYRWNQVEAASAYDAAAPVIHPKYEAVQDAILATISCETGQVLRIVDLGAGSGRLVERILRRFPTALAIVVDQSEPFLKLAKNRLAPYAGRATFLSVAYRTNGASMRRRRTSSSAPRRSIISLPRRSRRCSASACPHLPPAASSLTATSIGPRMTMIIAPYSLSGGGIWMTLWRQAPSPSRSGQRSRPGSSGTSTSLVRQEPAATIVPRPLNRRPLCCARQGFPTSMWSGARICGPYLWQPSRSWKPKAAVSPLAMKDRCRPPWC